MSDPKHGSEPPGGFIRIAAILPPKDVLEPQRVASSNCKIQFLFGPKIAFSKFKQSAQPSGRCLKTYAQPSVLASQAVGTQSPRGVKSNCTEGAANLAVSDLPLMIYLEPNRWLVKRRGFPPLPSARTRS